MKDEIKEILQDVIDDIYQCGEYIGQAKKLEKVLDCITNLQEELKSANESITWWTNRYKALQNRNIELVLERDRLRENNNAMQEEMAMTWKKLDKVKECIKDFLCTEEYCKLNGEAIADNYMKLLSIVDGEDLDTNNNIIKEQGLEDKPNYYEKGLIGSIKERDEIIQDYKLRNEKAIEKIKKIQENAIKYGAYHDASICQDLLNILEGEDKDVKD